MRCAQAKDQVGLTEAINDFFEIWRTHTRFEEDLMKKTNFPLMIEHQNEHRKITSEILALFNQSVSGGFIDKELVVRKMEYWFDEHLLNCDTELVKHLAMDRVSML